MASLGLCGAVDGEAKVPDFPCLASPENIRRLYVSMENSHFQQILDCLYDLASNSNSLLFT